jgi:hypothetical protein
MDAPFRALSESNGLCVCRCVLTAREVPMNIRGFSNNKVRTSSGGMDSNMSNLAFRVQNVFCLYTNYSDIFHLCRD